MKKFIILLFVLIQGFVFSTTKSLSDIKILKFEVLEKTNIKSKKREIDYRIDFILPNKIKKEVIAPELNKGEVYIYNYSKNEKIVYLPMFNEVKETQIVDDENRIIKAINKIITEEKQNKNFKEKYYAKEPQSLNIDNRIKIDILSYIDVEGYVFPEVIDIKDENTKVGNIKISNLQINPKLEERIILNISKK